MFATEVTEYKPVAGDMLIQSFPNSDLTKAIESCTNSVYSHCGILEFRANRWFIIEAIGPVKETPMLDWINHGRNGKFVALRLKDKYLPKITELIKAATAYMGGPYDIHMSMDDERIYCSELLYKSFKDVYNEELGVIQKLGDLNWKPNERFIRSIENGGLPLNRNMITPLAIIESDKVTKVYSNY
jgi:hypothetical protein